MEDDHNQPRTGRVRIIGAEPAGEVESFEPDDLGPVTDDDVELPHWTEAPTGQVPAVLADDRDDEADPWASLPEPTWREEHTDWAAHEDAFDPAMLAADDDLDGEPERQPWAFDLDPLAKTTSVPVVRGQAVGDPFGADPESPDAPGRRDPDDGTPRDAHGEAETVGDEYLAGDTSDDQRAARAASADTQAVPRVGGPGRLDPNDATDAMDTSDAAVIGEGAGHRGRRVRGLSAAAAAAEGLSDEPVVGDDRRDGGMSRRLRSGRLPRPGDGSEEGDGGDGRAGAERAAEEVDFLDLPPREDETPHNRLRPGSRRVAPAAGPTAGPDGLPAGHRPGRPGAGAGAGVGPVAAGGAGGAARTSHRRDGGRNIPVAIASGLAVGAVTVVCFYFGTVSSMVVATAAVGLAALEGYAAFRKAGYHPATLLGLVAVVGVMVGAYSKGEAAEPLVVVLLVAFTLLWHLLRVDKGADPVRSSLSTVFVYAWVGVFGSYAALLLSPTNFPHRHGIAFLLGAVITVVAYDVAALAIGSWVGQRPLSTVSPNKTWEGLIGGSVAAIVVAVLLVHLIHPWTIGKAAALGVIVVVLAPIGDLAESLVKRYVGLKDMGRLLPGHGGLLDRIDGLLFVLPATYYLVRAFHLG